ncbi:MAG: efflux RND transporter periplasmic adaptor subunit [Gemmatimonadota bacterium]|jgi:multidrug efflux pump subunit AcrA (membrane-fusion protein)
MKGLFSMKRIVVGIFILALVAVVVTRVIQASAPVEPTLDVEEIHQQAGIPVEVLEVAASPMEARRSFTGSVRGVRSATVRARTGDEILEIPVRVGQRVQEGEVVVRQSSQGSMASVRQAEAAFEQAQRAADRLRPLHERGAVSDQDWDNALTALRVAEANLEAAQRNIVLTSPITGVVTDILETSGTFPGNGDPLVRISDLSQVQLLLQVSPEQKAELALGQPAFLPGREVQGRVTRIALQADPETRLVEVEVTFPGSVTRAGPAEGSGAAGGSGAGEASGAVAVLPGTLATVEIVVGTRESALQIPPAALHGDAVWVVDAEGLAHRRPVTVGLRARDLLEVLEGLAPGDRVVTSGASLLSEGVLARVVTG